MAIEFDTEIQAAIYGKLGCYLRELDLPHDRCADRPSYRVTKGSAAAHVAVGAVDSDALVSIISQVVTGARVDDPELLRFLLDKNHASIVGGLALSETGDIYLSHTLVGSSCTRAQLKEALGHVLNQADALDDEIVARWGGRRFVEGAPPAIDGPADAPKKRTVHGPTAAGRGDGKAFYFLFGYRVGHATDQAMLERELGHIDDDIAALQGAGYRVVVERSATRDDLLSALYGKGEGAEGLATAGVFWSGHGAADGFLQTCDDGRVGPDDIAPAEVSPELRVVILSSCYVGSRSRTWRRSLGGRPLVVGWGRSLTLERAVDFLDPHDATENDLDDILRRYLLNDTPIPAEAGGEALSPRASVLVSGTIERLRPRLARIADVLHATLSEDGPRACLHVPLDGGRRRAVTAAEVASSEPYLEGEPLLAVEADVGELSAVVEASALLAADQGASYARVAAVKGEIEMPRLVVQGFLPLARARDQDLAALFFQVAERADALSRRIFGTS